MQTNERERAEAQRLIEWGLAEDLGEAGDITTQAVVPAESHERYRVVPRRDGVAAGLFLLPLVAERLPVPFEARLLQEDGPCRAGQPVAEIEGPTRSLLTAERLLLNLLGRLSGVATLTARYVAAVGGTRARIVDTRKTTPGWRFLEKYAVRVGGGTNHRLGLFDGVLIKDNHLASLGLSAPEAAAAAVRRARRNTPSGTFVQVEVDTLEQLDAVLAEAPDSVLLDNMSPTTLRDAVARRDASAPGVVLEASGGVTLESIRPIAESGVDRISVGALTHSASGLDFGLDA